MKSKTIHLPFAVALLGAVLPLPAALRAAEYIAYDASGNIVAHRVDSKTVGMAYDAGNRLVQSVDSGQPTAFSYDDSGAMVSELREGAEVAFEYRYGSRLSRRVENGESVEVFYDHRGYPVAKRSRGEVTPWLWEGSRMVAIGDEPQRPELANVDFLGTDLGRRGSLYGGADSGVYTGKHFDEDLQSYVFPYRFYRPDLLRWNVPDPAGYPDGINTFAYLSDPNTSIDPLGLWEIDIPSQAGGAAALGWEGNNPILGKTNVPDQPTLDGDMGGVVSEPVDPDDEETCYCAGYPDSTFEGFMSVPYEYSSPEFITNSGGVQVWYVAQSQTATIAHELEHVNIADMVGIKTYGWFEAKVRDMFTNEFQHAGDAELAADQDGNDMLNATMQTYTDNYETVQMLGHQPSSRVSYNHPLGGPLERWHATTPWGTQAMAAAQAITVEWGPIDGDCEN